MKIFSSLKSLNTHSLEVNWKINYLNQLLHQYKLPKNQNLSILSYAHTQTHCSVLISCGRVSRKAKQFSGSHIFHSIAAKDSRLMTAHIIPSLLPKPQNPNSSEIKRRKGSELTHWKLEERLQF
jgi:hypothetical protein